MPFPLPRDLPNSGIEPTSPVTPILQVDSLPAEPSGKPEETKWSLQVVIPPSSSFIFLIHDICNGISLKTCFHYFHHFYYIVLASPKKYLKWIGKRWVFVIISLQLFLCFQRKHLRESIIFCGNYDYWLIWYYFCLYFFSLSSKACKWYK